MKARDGQPPRFEAGARTMRTTTKRSYRCDAGHDIEAHEPPTACPACVRGVPCDAEVRPVGRRK